MQSLGTILRTDAWWFVRFVSNEIHLVKNDFPLCGPFNVCVGWERLICPVYKIVYMYMYVFFYLKTTGELKPGDASRKFSIYYKWLYSNLRTTIYTLEAG